MANHIHDIEIKNFKSIRHQKIEDCRRVNVFIGYPNVGKSNILEAIGLYSVTQQVYNERFSLNSICRFNHYSDLHFDKNVKNKIEVGLNKNRYTLLIKKDVSFADFGIYVYSEMENLPVFETHVGNNRNFQSYSPSNNNGISDSEISIIKLYRFKDNNEERQIKSSALSIPNGDNLLDILQGNGELRREYSELLNKYRLKLNISEENGISVAKELMDGTFVSFQNNLVSDTLRRLFFYLAARQSNRNSVLLFEEPEAHMFPPYVSKFTADVMYDDNNNQFFIATHSPFVLNDFMENLKYDELSIYAVGYKKETGETEIRRLSEEELNEIYQYGIDLFFNLERYLASE